MPEMPSHPDDGTGSSAGAEPEIARMSRGRKAAVISVVLVLVLVVLVVVLHLTGVVGAGSN